MLFSCPLKEYSITICDIDEAEATVEEEGIVYSQVGFVAKMSRRTQTYVLKYYVPCLAMVVISFMSFAIPADAIPGRVALLVTVFLVLSTFFGEIQVASGRRGTNLRDCHLSFKHSLSTGLDAEV